MYLCFARILASHRSQSSVGVHAADVAAALAVGHWGSDDSVGSSFGGSGVDTLLSRVIPRFFLALGSSCGHHDAAWAARVVRRCNFMSYFFGVIPFALNSHLCTCSACLISLPSASALSTCIMTVSAMQPSSWGLRFVHDVACTLAPLLPLIYKQQHVNLQSIIRLLWFEQNLFLPFSIVSLTYVSLAAVALESLFTRLANPSLCC